MTLNMTYIKSLGRRFIPERWRGDVGSYFYRNNRASIEKGDVPYRYTRLLAHISGNSILELGAAEGVLALLLANEGKRVWALEKEAARHKEAKRLQRLWASNGKMVDSCEMIHADLRERMDLLQSADTLVAIRSIYYLRDDLQPVLSEVAKTVSNVVLCGNVTRIKEVEGGRVDPRHSLGHFDYYATVPGMRALLEGVGYEIATVVDEDDPIVVGRKRL